MANKKNITILVGAIVSAPVLGMGQSDPVQQVRRATIAAAASGGQIAHTVQRGENLWRIARDHGFTEQELMDFNRLPNSVIRPGQVIRMPGRPLPHPAADMAVPAVTPTAVPTASLSTYTVKSGDALTKIARILGVSADALMKVNGITDPNKLRVGQTLKVPGGSNAVTPASYEPSTAATHTVRKGDTLFRIAAQHRVSIAQVKAANKLATEQLQIGQSLIIPGSGSANTVGEVVPASATTPPPVQPKVSDYGTYTVQRGDSFSKIARQFGTTSSELIRINEITNPNILIAGQTLTVPGGIKMETTPITTSASGGTMAATTTPGSEPAQVATPAEIAPPVLPDPSPVRSGGVQDYAGYTIVPGDTLDTIAQTFATTKAELMRLNKLSSPDEVKSGDQILVPTYGIYNDLGGPY